MTKEDYLKLPKERLAELLAERDIRDEIQQVKVNLKEIYIPSIQMKDNNPKVCLRYNYTTKNENIKRVIDNLKIFIPDEIRHHINLSIMKVWQEDERKIDGDELNKQVLSESKDWGGVNIGAGFGFCYVDQEHFNCVFPNGLVDKCNNIDPEKCRGKIGDDGEIVWDKSLPFPLFTVFSDKDSVCFNCKFLPICFGPCPKERDSYYNLQQHLACRYTDAITHWQQTIQFYCYINVLSKS